MVKLQASWDLKTAKGDARARVKKKVDDGK